MAKVNAAAFKAAMATAAADLTTAMQDDTLTELANEYKDALHPARNLPKLFILNKVTGVYTANDAYVDEFYAGNFPNLGKLVDGQGTPTPITVVSATLETAQPRDIVITFSEKIFFNSSTLMTIAGAAAAGKTIVSVTISTSGLIMTIVVSADFIAAGVVTVSGRAFGNHNNYVDLVAQAVTNNIA